MTTDEFLALTGLKNTDQGQEIRWRTHDNRNARGTFYGVLNGKVLVQSDIIIKSYRKIYSIRPEKIYEVEGKGV